MHPYGARANTYACMGIPPPPLWKSWIHHCYSMSGKYRPKNVEVEKIVSESPPPPPPGGGALDFQMVGVCRWGVENRTLSSCLKPLGAQKIYPVLIHLTKDVHIMHIYPVLISHTSDIPCPIVAYSKRNEKLDSYRPIERKRNLN